MPFSYARYLVRFVRAFSIEYAHYKHRFEGRGRSNAKAFVRRRCKFFEHLRIPIKSMMRRGFRITIQLTLVRTLYSQFKVACLTAAIASYSLSLLTDIHEAIRSLLPRKLGHCWHHVIHGETIFRRIRHAAAPVVLAG